MLLEQRAPLTLGHPTPDAELDTVVQCISTTLQHHRAVPADDRRFALRGPPHKQLVRIGGPAQRLGNPGDP
jgi:hypothetical protein